MSDAYGVMREAAARLAKREGKASLSMAHRWGTVEKRLWVYFDALIDDIAREGVKTDSQIFRLHRYEQLIGAAQDEISQYEAWAGERISSEQRRAMDAGFEAAVRTAYGDRFFTPVIDRAAVENMVGLCADGAPLFSLLKQRALAPWAVEGLTNALVEAVALGYNPRKTARLMADGLAQGLDKALLIARTEQMRVYREATRSGYQQMGVQRYRRHCAKSDRTCLACLALDGKIYDTSEIMDSHPGCRCFMTAVIPGDTDDRATAQEWFAGRGEEWQRKVLGKERFGLYKQGVPLSEMAQVRNDPVWGPTLGLKPVNSLRTAKVNIAPAGEVIRQSKIDFRSDTSQYVTDLGDLAKYYAGDPGEKYVVSKPVYYNKFGSGHLTDQEHQYRLRWLDENQEGLLVAIQSPDFIERRLRARDDGFFSATLIKELRPGTKSEDRFMTIAISLSLESDGGFHQITTIHPTNWKALFYANGALKKKYLKTQ